MSVDVPSVAGRDLAAASRTVVTRMHALEAGDISDRALGSYTFAGPGHAEGRPGLRGQLVHAGRHRPHRVGPRHPGRRPAQGQRRRRPRHPRRGPQRSRRPARVKDTDEGRFDEDRRWDRAVGPMQLLPSTWSYVGVDGDGNGKRTPDDLDDAALAVGVYLCAAADKATEKGGEEGRQDLRRVRRHAQGARVVQPLPGLRRLARQLDREYLEAYGVTPYSAAPEGASLQAISLVGPLAPTLSPDRAVVAARAATAAKDAPDADGYRQRNGSKAARRARTARRAPNGSERLRTAPDGPGNGPSRASSAEPHADADHPDAGPDGDPPGSRRDDAYGRAADDPVDATPTPGAASPPPTARRSPSPESSPRSRASTPSTCALTSPVSDPAELAPYVGQSRRRDLRPGLDHVRSEHGRSTTDPSAHDERG